jgi:muramoyltetrapeptide carboxypeptidase
MDRSSFLKSIAALAALGGLTPLKADTLSARPADVIKPKRVKKGDTFGIIAPAGYITEKMLAETITNMETLGFKAVHTDRILKRNGYLAGTDKERADDVNEMFSRKDVDAIICARGGYGIQRMLDLIDYDVVKNNPKILIGYSDVTALLYALFSQAGLISFHGPVGTSTYNDYSTINFMDALTCKYEKLDLLNELEEMKEIITIRSGECEGELIGGNLSLMSSMIGSKYDVDYSGKILFIEEVGEDPYRIDRMFTQMLNAGKLQQAAGIVMGRFSKCDLDPDKPAEEYSFTLQEVLSDRLFNLGIPAVYGFSFGHVVNKLTLPFGCKAKLDVDNLSLTLLESATI